MSYLQSDEREDGTCVNGPSRTFYFEDVILERRCNNKKIKKEKKNERKKNERKKKKRKLQQSTLKDCWLFFLIKKEKYKNEIKKRMFK